MEFSGSFLSRCGRTVPGNMRGLIDAMIQCQGAGGMTIENLYIVYKECQDWRKKHVSSFFATKSNQKEESAVVHLMSEVVADLNAIEPGLGTALESYQAGKAGSGPQAKSFTSLGDGYRFERESYLAGGKQEKPFSGTKIKEKAEGQGIDFHRMKRRNWDELAQTQKVRMYFLNKAQRLKLLVTCENQANVGPRWVNIAGQQAHTRFAAFNSMASGPTLQMYAMDRYGNLFVDYDSAGHAEFVMGYTGGQKTKVAVDARGVTNHSSFCAGREVICAGMIFFWKGQLLHIDNQSGHYAPNRNALYKALEVLRDSGADLDYLRVGYVTANSSEVFYARSFLRNAQNGDWPDQNVDNDHTAHFQAIPSFQI